jgi:uncharacterized protein YsxB (DUF464 family)
MITVTKTKFGFTVTGHANFDVEGKDIVCSAISALSQSVAMTLERWGYSVTQVRKKGYMSASIETIHEEADMIMDVLFTGANALMNTYPDHVKFKEEKE